MSNLEINGSSLLFLLGLAMTFAFFLYRVVKARAETRRTTRHREASRRFADLPTDVQRHGVHIDDLMGDRS